MTCTCSGHPNEPNPCPECEREAAEWEVLSKGDRDEALGEWLRENYSRINWGKAVVEQFIESRLEAAITCPEERP